MRDVCGRFDETIPIEKLAKRFSAAYQNIRFGPRYNIAPSQQVPCVINTGKAHELKILKWGLVPQWAKDPKIGSKMINARAETLAQKPSFREAFQKRRCLVPATGFFEWHGTGKDKVPYRVTLLDEGPFGMAGLWEHWVDKQTGEILETFTIITTDANELLTPIHNRMPVILMKKDEKLWLDTAVQESAHLQELLKPHPADRMKAYKISAKVNSPRNDEPAVIQPAQSAFIAGE